MYIRDGRLVGYGPSARNIALSIRAAFFVLSAVGISLHDWRMMHIIATRPHILAHVNRAWTEGGGKGGYRSFADVSFSFNNGGTIETCNVQKLFLGHQEIDISKLSVTEVTVSPGGCYDPIAVVAYPLSEILKGFSLCAIFLLAVFVIWRQG